VALRRPHGANLFGGPAIVGKRAAAWRLGQTGTPSGLAGAPTSEGHRNVGLLASEGAVGPAERSVLLKPPRVTPQFPAVGSGLKNIPTDGGIVTPDFPRVPQDR